MSSTRTTTPRAPRPRRGPVFGGRSACLLLTVVVLAAAATSAADRVVWKDGRTTRGRIVAEDPETVVMAVGSPGARVRMEIPRARIKAVIRSEVRAADTAAPATAPAAAPKAPPAEAGSAKDVPLYYPLPIAGEIGTEVKAETLALALKDVRAQAPDYVVLYIDSGGGSVQETRRILDVLAGAQDLKLVAYVRQALSAAAVIAMTCPDIYARPSAIMGGAVPYKVGPDGTPKTVEEKFQSVIRAQFRAAAEMGGHSSLLVEAMMDPDVELYLKEAEGKKTLARSGPGKLIKAKGKILTLTPREAMTCGVVKGTAPNLASVHKAMGLPRWERCEGKGWALLAGQAAIARRKLDKAEQREARAEAMEKIAPELKKIDGQLKQIESDLKLVGTEMAMLKKEYDREVAAIHAEYERDRRRAGALGAVGRVRERENLIRQARVNRDNKLNGLRRRFEPKVRQLKLRTQQLNTAQAELQTKRRNLILRARQAAQ